MWLSLWPRGIIDMIFAFRQIAEKVRKKNQEMNIMFVDIKKTFDTVNREALWKVLKRFSLPDSMLSAMTSSYEGMEASVIYPMATFDLFGVTIGTKQGFVMDSVLFALYISVRPKHGVGVKFQFLPSGGLFKHQRFKAKTQAIIRDVLFADDATLTAASLEEAEFLVDRFYAAWPDYRHQENGCDSPALSYTKTNPGCLCISFPLSRNSCPG